MRPALRPFGRPVVLAVSISFVCLVVSVAAWVLFATAPPGPVRPLWYWLMAGEKTVVGLSFTTIGMLIVAHLPRLPLAWLFMLIGGCDVLYPFLGAVLRHGPPEGPRTAVFLMWLVVNVAGVVLFPLLTLFTPDGVLPGRRWRWIYPVLSLIGAAQLTALLLTVPVPGGRVLLPGVPEAGVVVLRVAIVAFQVVWAVCLIATYRDLRRRPKGLRRRQITVVMTIFTLGYVAFFLEMWFTDQSFARAVVTVPDELLNVLRLLLAVVGVPVVGFALTRTHLHQIDRAARATVIAVTVIGGLVLAYTLATALLSSVLPGAASTGALVIALATGLAGFGLRDAVGAVRRRVDRAFYGDRAEPYRVLRALPSKLNEGLPPGEIPLAVCQTVVSVLRLPAAAIEVDGRRLASIGASSGPPVELPLVHQQRRIGVLLVWPRSGQSSLDDLDIAALEPLVEQTATVISTMLIGERLERNIEEERLRLRRDLHDGLGPALAGVTLQLSAVRTMLAPRSEEAALLENTSVHMRQILDDFRRVTRNQRPLLLEEYGLRGALVELCRRLSTTTTPVTAQIPEHLPPLQEDAVFHVAAESLTNAARHASATAIILTVTVEPSHVVVEVRDNGAGIAEPSGFGIGLASMRRRVAATGGEWDLDTSPSGTVVRACFPRVES
ncbi:sensor histidine kinase [Allokutzneria albata]|uniref:Oxygen sensor histidine kinase NreB n=1 Tax=Allokutzneria albata TaxID=211114 RepID=A0A1G9V1U6_ALLAB|nr:ATP-binding protein [Allokutzneria albata]SDM66099.1 Histidine kinase-, DNA gyrase B-, and HSP90-like ATPase [Allokutzneria albata]